MGGARDGTTDARTASKAGGTAAHSKAETPANHEHRRLCGRRDTKGDAGERLARRSSPGEQIKLLNSAARHRAWRVFGVVTWPAQHRAQRPASRSVRQAGSFTRSVNESKPAIPGHGNGPLQ